MTERADNDPNRNDRSDDMNQPWETCERCNYDRHICPGCGENLNHGIEVCLRCRNQR